MNDMILNLLANDSFTVSDFKAAGLTANNTKLESEQKYLQSEMIQENQLFKDADGNFSEDLFHQYYLHATSFYNDLVDDSYIEDITKNTFYSKDNIFAPGDSPKIDETPQFVTSPNPFLQSNSLTRVGKKGDRTLSIAEIAQSQKVYDSKTNQFKEESVNDRALGQNAFKWLGDIFSEPLVIAQWDEDGEHIDLLTGERKTHKKGDYKYNEDGTFYYETLNGRDVYSKQVLNRMNTLTVDGSKANNYDFFDSDDLEQKSVVGNVMKNLALVGSMFLPVVGKPIIAASIASQSLGLMGALGKMFLGSENETVNNMHAWAKTVNRQSVSEYASQNTWCWENMINMIGDTVGQLAEQRFLFTHVPALFKGTKGINAKNTKTYNELVEEGAKSIRNKTGKDLNNAINAIKAGTGEGIEEEIGNLTKQWVTSSHLKSAAALEKYMESYNKLGSIMSKAYMTGITVQDTYGEAKANGASDMEALALTLGYAAGEAWILNTGLGEWIMPELQGDKLKYRAIVNALKKEVKEVTGDATEAATREGRQNIFKKVFNIGKKIATDDYARAQFASKTFDPMKVVLAHAAGEGFEEVSEEVLADVSKSAFNVVNWLRGDDTRIAGAWEDMGNRYGMSLIGGFLGGGISSAGTDFSYAKQLGQMTNESAIQEIVYMINNDKIDDFQKFVNKADLGYKQLSFDHDENGNFKPGTKDNNQDREIKNILNQQIQLIKDTVAAEGAKFSENSLFDALTLKDLRYLQLRDTRTAGLMFQEYNSLISQIYAKTREIRRITGEDSNTDTKKKELSDSEKGEVAKLKQELNDLRVRKDAFTSGKRAPEFIAAALYEASEALHGHRRGYTLEGFVKSKTGKNISEVPDTELEKLKTEYKAYRETEMKNDVVGDARQFVDLVGMSSAAIQAQSDYIDNMLTTGRESALKVQVYLDNMFDGINRASKAEDFDVDTFIQETQTKLANVLAKTESELATPLFSPETKARLDYISKATIDDQYTKEVQYLDYMSTVLESFADYADTITQQFIDQGYIHPEVKNHLINTYQHAIDSLETIKNEEALKTTRGEFKLLNRLSAYLGKTREEVEEIATDEERARLFQDYQENLQQKIEQIKALSHTPVVDLLESFKVATSTTDLSVKDVLTKVNQLINQGYADISTITYGDDLGKQIQEVDELIDLLASSLYATRVDKSSTINAWGYSKTLNELNKKYGNKEWVELAEIEGEKADLLMQDLSLIKQKLLFAKNLNGVNNGQKLNQQSKVGYNKQFIFFNKFERFVNELPDELTDWNFSSIQEALRNANILKKYNSKNWSERRFSLTPEEKIDIEKESLMLDDAIYQFFQDNADKVNNVDELSKLINPNHFHLYDPVTSLLNDTVEDLDDNQFIFSLAARAALKGSSFYNYLRKGFHDEKAPIPMQEQATYLNVAMAMNGDVMNNFAKAYAKSIFDQFKGASDDKRRDLLRNAGYDEAQIDFYIKNPDQFQNEHFVEKFANIILTEGIAGSGKTEGVFDSTVRVLRQIKPDILENAFVVNATLANAESLRDKLELSGKVFSSSNDEKDHDLIRYFYSDFDDDYKDKVDIVGGKLETNFTLKEDLKDIPKIIFIDEASRYDYVKMKLLSEAAQHYGIAVFAAGDFDQISAESNITIKGTPYNLSPNRLNFIRSPKLGLSFRTLNSQMVANQKEVQANLHTPGKLEFNIHSWEDENEIRGFKVYQDSEFDKIVESINKLKKSLKSGEKIGFLYADEEKSMHKRIKEKFGDLIDVKSITDAQGLEGDYYIIDLNQRTQSETKKSEQKLRDEFYTAFTRAKKGGIIINNQSGNPIYAREIKDEASELESITPEQISAASRKRKELFDKIFKDTPDEPIEYHALTPVKKEAKAVKPSDEDGTDDGIAPVLPEAPVKTPPAGTYTTREAAEKVDLSAYTVGFELLNSDDSVEGVIEGTEVIEHPDSDGTVYYAPVVKVKYPDGSVKGIYAEALSKYKLRDPATSTLVPKYKVGDVFYDSEGKSIEITEVIPGTTIEYKIKDQTGTIQTIKETDLEGYSTIPPIIKPVTNDDSDLDENEESENYKRKIEGANGANGGRTIKPRIESDGRINHWMYTFNAYETGVLWEDDKIKPELLDINTPMGQRTAARIDNVNGLIKLGLGAGRTKQEYMQVLADIHSELMHNKDNSDLLVKVAKRISEYLPAGTLSTIEYGIKSSAMVSDSSGRVYGTSDEDTEWFVFDKHKEEKSEYASPNVVAGDALSRKDVVAVFRDSEGKKVLEITLGVLNSPLTIGQMTNESGEYIYPEIGSLLEQLKPGMSGEEVFKVCSQAVDICKDKGYIDLGNLFKAFLNTANGFAPLHEKGTEFNLASQFNYGPNVIQEKGDYQKDGTRQYKTEYIDLEEYVKDERVVVSDVWIPKTNVFGTQVYHHIHPGHAGVFVSYNKNYNKAQLADLYMKQLSPTYTGVRDIEFYYVIPPEASAREYLKNARNAYLNQVHGGTRSVFPIGNMWTSYKLLRNIYQGGDLWQKGEGADAEYSLKSKYLDKVELQDVIDYIDEMLAVETKTDWSGDPDYEQLLTEYKKIYSNEAVAKKYAIRNARLKKQRKILESEFKDTSIQVHKVFSNYLANAAYWGKGIDEAPDEDTLKLIEKHNKGTLKYKVTYAPEVAATGMFVPAKTDPHNPHLLATINADGSVSSKAFQINRKIDPPIFEFDALKTGIAIMAQWEYNNPKNTNEGKKIVGDLLNGTRGYLRDTKSVKKSETAFEKLKDNNKILFGKTGLFKDIEVRGTEDPALDQVHFAKEILTQFNSEPNHLGFAIVGSDGEVKMYAMDISKMRGNISKPEAESFGSLGGVTINQPLVFETPGSIFNFSSDIRDYTIQVVGNELLIQHVTSTEKPKNVVKVEYSNTYAITEGIFNNAQNYIQNSTLDDFTKEVFKGLTYADLMSYTLDELSDYARALQPIADSELELQNLYDFMTHGATATLNLTIGDKVTLNNAHISQVKTVKSIDGDLVTLEDNTVIDLKTTSLFKALDYETINCVHQIKFKYGR